MTSPVKVERVPPAWDTVGDRTIRSDASRLHQGSPAAAIPNPVVGNVLVIACASDGELVIMSAAWYHPSGQVFPSHFLGQGCGHEPGVCRGPTRSAVFEWKTRCSMELDDDGGAAARNGVNGARMCFGFMISSASSAETHAHTLCLTQHQHLPAPHQALPVPAELQLAWWRKSVAVTSFWSWPNCVDQSATSAHAGGMIHKE